jgi:signal transduction histidine kinase
VSALRSSLLVLVTATAAALATGAVYGARDAALTWLLLVALGGGALALAHVVAARRRRLGSLRRQFALAVAIAVGQVVVFAWVGAQLMFVSAHDVFFVVVIAALAGIVAVRAAALFAGGVMDDIERLRATLVAVGEGAREPAAAAGGDDELAELTRAANAAIAKLAAAEEARRGLIAAVSHDLRTPITSLRLLAEAVDDDIVDGETRARYLGRMRIHIDALAALIDDLFEFSRLEAGDIAWTLQRVPLGELVGETVEAMRVQAAAKRVEVRALVPDGIAPAHAHPEQLQRVLFNLIQNAIRHTPADGSITVSAEAADDRLEIEVADTGDGIPAPDLERVFDPFFRGGTEAARTRNGAGLGLAISRAIVEAHGGRIWVEDAALGARVRFSLRPAPAPVPAAAPAAPLQPAP